MFLLEFTLPPISLLFPLYAMRLSVPVSDSVSVYQIRKQATSVTAVTNASMLDIATEDFPRAVARELQSASKYSAVGRDGG